MDVLGAYIIGRHSPIGRAGNLSSRHTTRFRGTCRGINLGLPTIHATKLTIFFESTNPEVNPPVISASIAS